MNELKLIGRVGKDVEYLTTEKSELAKFSLATSERYTNKAGEKIETTEWTNIVIWGRLASVARDWIKKGDLLYVSGPKKTNVYEDKEGNKKYSVYLDCKELEMLGNKNQQNEAAPVAETANVPEADKDDLPF